VNSKRRRRRAVYKEMEKYGFADYKSPGDIVGHTRVLQSSTI